MDPTAILERLNQIDEEGASARNFRASKWDSNIKVARGDVWPTSSNPLFSANVISPAIRRKAGLLVETKPVLEVRPVKKGFQTAADTLKKTIRAIWDEQSIPMSLEELAFLLNCFGSGFFKIGYDPLSDYGEGSITVVPIDPRLVIIDPAITKSYRLDKAQYIREEMVVPLSWVKRRFPKTAGEVKADSSLSVTGNEQHKISFVQRAIASMFKRTAQGTVASAIPRVYLREYWIADDTTNPDGSLKYPGGRRILRTGDDIILNPDADSDDPADPYGQQNPYFDGLWPYEMLDNEPDVDHPWGHAEVESVKKLNEAFNRVGNTTVSTLMKNLEWVIADNNALRPDVINDLKRLQAVVMEKQPGRTVERVPPTQPTSTNLDFMRLMLNLIEMQTGLTDGSMQGRGRIELRSQPQLEGLQQVAQVLIRSQCRRLESFLERCGQKLISRIFQFFTDDRLMSYIDKDQLKEYEFKKEDLRREILEQALSAKRDKAIKETEANLRDGADIDDALVVADSLTPDEIEEAIRGAWRLFRFRIVPFSSLASNRMARAALLQELAGQQLIPPSMVLEEAGFDNYEELLRRFKEDLDKRAAVGLPPPEPPQKGRKKR